jgi:hypothetical protein
MKTYFKQWLTQFGRFQAVASLVLCCLLIITGLPRPAQTFAQDGCQELNDLLTFDYRNWGIGVHRDCDCEADDIVCHLALPACFALKEKQILLGKPVETWIHLSKAAALAAGVSPIPPEIRAQLDHLYPASLLDKVRYKTGSGFLGTLQWFRDEMGGGAITLDNVIVFFDQSKEFNPKLWAHELEHVRQYNQLGVDGFAQAYVDQTCILPGELGYDSGRCQLERRAERKSNYWNQRPTVVIRDQMLNETKVFSASDSITIGPNVVLQPGGNVTLLAGRLITLSPEFRTEPGGKLEAKIDPNLRPSCPIPAPR